MGKTREHKNLTNVIKILQQAFIVTQSAALYEKHCRQSNLALLYIIDILFYIRDAQFAYNAT